MKTYRREYDIQSNDNCDRNPAQPRMTLEFLPVRDNLLNEDPKQYELNLISSCTWPVRSMQTVSAEYPHSQRDKERKRTNPIRAFCIVGGAPKNCTSSAYSADICGDLAGDHGRLKGRESCGPSQVVKESV